MSQKDTQNTTDLKPGIAPQPQSTLPKQMETSSNQETVYRCPYCEETYENELLTRVHITRSDDTPHQTHNGLMPEVEIEAIEDGKVIETISRQPDEIDIESLTVGDFPDEINERDRHVLLVAAQSPYEDNYRKLTGLTQKQLKKNGFDTLSYSSVRRIIREFYRSEIDDSEPTQYSELSDLTPLQLAVVLGRLTMPDESNTRIADKIGCARSYPSQIFERAQPLLDKLDEVGDEEFKELIHEVVSEDVRCELNEKGLLENLPITLEVDDETIDLEPSKHQKWGSPVTESKTLQASPDNLLSPDGNDNRDSIEDSKITSGNISNENESNEEAAIGGREGVESVSTSDIEDLKQKITFLRKLFDNTQCDVNAELMVSFARQVEQECTMLVQE